MNTYLSDMYNNDDRVKYLIDMARSVEGMPGMHPPRGRGCYIQGTHRGIRALYRQDSGITTQYPMGNLEELGL